MEWQGLSFCVTHDGSFLLSGAGCSEFGKLLQILTLAFSKKEFVGNETIMPWHMLCDTCLTRYRTEPVDRTMDIILLPKCTKED